MLNFSMKSNEFRVMYTILSEILAIFQVNPGNYGLHYVPLSHNVIQVMLGFTKGVTVDLFSPLKNEI